MKRRTATGYSILAVFFSLSVILCSSGAVSAASAPKKAPKKAALPQELPLIGLKYGPALPKGYEDLGGGFMADENHRLTEFGLQYVRGGKKKEMMWFYRVVGTDPSGKQVCQIIDVLALPHRQKNEIVAWFACFFNGRKNEQIIAYTDKYYFKVHRAWYANRQTGKFQEISSQGVICADPVQE